MLKIVTFMIYLYFFFCVVGEDYTQLAAAEVVEIACWLFYDFPGLLLSILGPATVASRLVYHLQGFSVNYSESISK